MRLVRHEDAVFPAGRLTFGTVRDDHGRASGLENGGKLAPHREAGTAAAGEARVAGQADHLAGVRRKQEGRRAR